jgi:aprataxin
MSSSKKPKATAPKQPPKPSVWGFNARDGLGVYIAHPEANPEGLVVEYDDDFVVIADMFPKARYALYLPPSLPLHCV